MSKEGKNLAKARHYLEANRYRDGAASMLLDRLRCDIPNSRLVECKFMLGVARLYIEHQLMQFNDIFGLNKVLKYIAVEPHLSEYDNNLNGEKLSVLLERFEGIIKEDLKQCVSISNKRELIPNMDYDIIPIDSQEEASKYREYTSWCVTNGSYDTYTSDGSGRFYFCLKKGFKDIEEKEGEGCPLDEYGLSMIAVSICMDGSVNTITCRWNHNNKGNDHILSVEQLEDIIGRNFYSTFKPYTKEELRSKGFILFDEVQDVLDSGADPCEIFKEVFRADENHDLVKLNNKYNFIDAHHKLLFKRWFDNAFFNFSKIDNVFSEGYVGVKLDGKWNFINTKGEFLSEQWFDGAGVFSEGYAKVYLDGKWNFINPEGEFLNEQWFDYLSVGNFHDGFAEVRLNGKSNFINTKCEFLSSQWFDYTNDFHEGFAVVRLNGKNNLINTKGKLISKQWFDAVGNFYNGIAWVGLNEKSNFINAKGKLISSQWFDWVGSFNDGFAIVRLNEKWNFINSEGKLLSKQWFDTVGNFYNGVAGVELNGKYNFINAEGKILCSQWYDWTDRTYNFKDVYETVSEGKINEHVI